MPRGRKPGSRNKPKTEKSEEEKSALEKEIILQRRKAVARKRAGKPAEVINLIKNYDEENTRPPKGNPIGHCKDCGKEFEQIFSEDRNAYSSYRICPDCRKKRSIRQSKKIQQEQSGDGEEKEVSVATLPYTPYEWQKEAEEAFWNHRFTVLACGNRCLLPGAFINGCDKFVEDVKKNDLVISKNGDLQKITDVDVEDYEGDIYTIKAVGLEPIRCNDNHPIMIAYGRKKNRDSKYEIYDEKLVCAKDIQSEIDKQGKFERLYVKMPRLNGSVKCNYWKFKEFEKNLPDSLDGMPLNEDTAWMIGLYIAEGCYLGYGGCKWTLNYYDYYTAQYLCKILDELGLHYNVRERMDEGTRCIIVTKTQFCKKMDEECGHGSKKKKIPSSILYNENSRLLLSFMKGYYSGDGYLNEETVTLHATTVSRVLVQQLQTAWTRFGAFSKISSMQRDRKRKNGTLCSKEYTISINNTLAIRQLGYIVRDKKERETAIISGYCIYTKLKSVKKEYGETPLIVLSTYDESFVSNGLVSRNSGKDRMTIMVAIKYFVSCLNENRLIKNPELVPPVLWWQIAPTEKMAKQNWRELKQYFPKEWIVACSDSNFQMETIGGGIIEVRSGYSPDDLVGVGLDLVTITEAARFKDLNLAWANLEARLNSPGRGRECDRKGRSYGAGKAIINSSPVGLNDFYDLYCYGQKSHESYSSVWWSAQYPWTCNPSNKELAESIVHGKYGDMTYEESLRRQIGERTFLSNYMASFEAENGAVFRNFEQKCVVNIHNYEQTKCKTKAEKEKFIKEWQQPELGEQYVIGYDPATGSSQDTPAVVVRQRSNNRIVRIYDLYGKTYTQQYDYIAEIAKLFNYAEVHWLRTGHTAIEGAFELRGITEIPLDEQGQKKGQLVQTLELAVESGAVQVLYDGSVEAETLINEMKDYTEENGKYSNNKAPHDDFVSALYAAFSDYNVAEIPIYYNPFIHTIK